MVQEKINWLLDGVGRNYERTFREKVNYFEIFQLDYGARVSVKMMNFNSRLTVLTRVFKWFYVIYFDAYSEIYFIPLDSWPEMEGG